MLTRVGRLGDVHRGDEVRVTRLLTVHDGNEVRSETATAT